MAQKAFEVASLAKLSLATTKRHNALMPNIASILKAEISRVARKEVRAEIETLKKASVVHRSSIADLRRQVSALEKELRRVAKGAVRPSAAPGSGLSLIHI